jgi:hypothetical protein
MLRTTTLLIAMVLAGAPAGSLACELWCTTSAAEQHHRDIGCHDAAAAWPKGRQVASTAGCHDAAAMTPFVTEARQTESGPVAAAPVTFFDSNLIVPADDKTNAGRCVFDVQSPRPSSRAILRV